MTDIIAIIGRPNVGKSTLFNRIIKNKLAITSPVAGVTRDRIIAPAEWNDRHFNLVDTGGIKTDFANDIEKETLSQAKQAIADADIIIFVVNGQEPITSIDRDITALLRKQTKPVITVVNKIDDFAKHKWDEYYELGCKTIIPISAEHNLNISVLLDAAAEYLKSGAVDRKFTGIKIALVGRPNVGKSSLFNKLAGENRSIVSKIPGTTRDSIDAVIRFEKKEYMFVDTAGMRKKNKITDAVERYSIMRTLKSISESDIVILMVDAAIGIEEQDLKIANLAIDNNKGIIIAVNKWDLIEKDDKTYKSFEDAIYRTAPFLKFAPIIFISAITGKRIFKIFELVDAIFANLHRRIPTSELNEFLNTLKSEYSMPADKNKKTKLNYITQVEAECPTFIVHLTHKELLTHSFKSFFINKLRAAFDFTGAPVNIFFKPKKIL